MRNQLERHMFAHEIGNIAFHHTSDFCCGRRRERRILQAEGLQDMLISHLSALPMATHLPDYASTTYFLVFYACSNMRCCVLFMLQRRVVCSHVQLRYLINLI